MAEAPIFKPATRSAQPSGIGGWLVLIALGQIFGPLKQLFSLGKYYYDTPSMGEIFYRYPVAMNGELIINLGLIGIILFTTYLFFTHQRSFKIWFTIEMLSTILCLGLDYLWISATANLPIAKVASEEEITKTLAATLLGLVWIAYVWRSKRVRNTFIK